jgi:D-alanyl-D-alanine carboxypeptidase/D-alanyl-D-alanine-endopeptidase (penicillin-binding protein 4)
VRAVRLSTLLNVALVVLLACAAAFGAFVGVHSLRATHALAQATVIPPSSAAPTPSAVASAALSPASGPTTSAPPLTAAAVAAALAGPLTDPALGARVLGEVTDAVTGQVLLDRSSTTPAAPASTAKLATAAAVLAVHASTDTITTTVVAGAAPGVVVLVGAGDPTLSAATSATPYADAARIADLATQLRAAGTPVTQVLVDGGLFTGPATSPSWLPADVPTSYAAPITALMVDGGRDTPTSIVRSAAPDLAAGAALAAALGLPAGRVARGSAPAGAVRLAAVTSAPYGDLVEQMLLESDNVIADTLARQVAIAEHQPVSFLGGAAAVRAVLIRLGVDIGAGMSDSSGLAATDRLTPAALTGVLHPATGPALRAVIDDLPSAGWDGTLAGRFTVAPASAGAGLVRAKTGTLTSVSTLAGVATTSTGRLLIFSFVADRVGPTEADTEAAEAALDTLAAALVAL